jgi:hypothetical protein
VCSGVVGIGGNVFGMKKKFQIFSMHFSL